jgi:FAD/FMN-containing dehydrogenase
MKTELSESAVQELKSDFRGEIVLPRDASYDSARRLYNAMIDRRPALIARCGGVADVIRAVNFGRAQELLVAIRGGGHNVAGRAMCDGGLVIDLSMMKGIRVDPIDRTARAEAGVLWGELDRETQAFGLATTGGTVSTTGIAGLTLGGGLGFLGRKHGPSCDNLLSVDVVTADGQLLTASDTQNQDLFWGMRGGGANFGVATSFDFRVHPVGPTVLGGMLLHPLSKAPEVLRFYRDFIRDVPDELTAMPAFLTPPDDSAVVAMLVAYIGPVEKGQEVIRRLREFGPPVADDVRPRPYRELQSMLDAGFPAGFHNYWKSNFLKGLSDEALDTMVSHFSAVPSPLSAVVVEHLGGATSRVGRDETSFNLRDGQHNLVIVARWSDPAEADKNIRWARDLWEAMQPFSAGAVYVNYLGGDESDTRLRAAYGAAHSRLVALKNKYDPTNFFRLNHNIVPTV